MNSKQKGGSFERVVCVLLSLWISRGKRKDLFWRSAMSGGRATVHGVQVRQAGDIAAVAMEGYGFTDRYVVECKHLRDLCLVPFLLENKGKTARIWATLKTVAKLHGKLPMLIAKQNRMPAIVVMLADDAWGSGASAFDFRVNTLDNLLKLPTPPNRQLLGDTLHKR